MVKKRTPKKKAASAKSDFDDVLQKDLQELMAAVKKQNEEHPWAWTGIICYPINGRCTGVTPMGHWCFSREEIIKSMLGELANQEPKEKVQQAAELLKTHDKVRCGRIIVEILKYPRNIETEGSEALGVNSPGQRNRVENLIREAVDLSEKMKNLGEKMKNLIREVE